MCQLASRWQHEQGSHGLRTVLQEVESRDTTVRQLEAELAAARDRLAVAEAAQLAQQAQQQQHANGVAHSESSEGASQLAEENERLKQVRLRPRLFTHFLVIRCWSEDGSPLGARAREPPLWNGGPLPLAGQPGCLVPRPTGSLQGAAGCG